MSRLDDIIGKLVFTSDADPELVNHHMPTIEAKQQIKDLMLELIGEDIGYGSATPDILVEAREAQNRLRADLRQKVEAL
jgi:hypothetical protein